MGLVGDGQIKGCDRRITHRLGDPWARLVGREDDRGTGAAEPAGNHIGIGIESGNHAHTELVGA